LASVLSFHLHESALSEALSQGTPSNGSGEILLADTSQLTIFAVKTGQTESETD
jgi:hypothetical protein